MRATQEGFIAVDWGTTNRRAYLIGTDGRLQDQLEDDAGVTSIGEGGFPAAIDAISRRLGDRPLLMAGMIGSNRGWREVPYIPCPAAIADLARHLCWIEPGRVAIVPGLCWSAPGQADVMRGEEVQVFGLLEQSGGRDMLLCHPGTHTKWVEVKNGAIHRFRTCMTGELFALLRKHSILAPLLAGDITVGEAFLAGVDAGLHDTHLAADLFSARARVLLGDLPEESAGPWISGLLVGADVRGGLALAGGDLQHEVTVLGRPSLNRLYAAALQRAGVQASQSDGAPAFIAGMQAIRKAAQ